MNGVPGSILKMSPYNATCSSFATESRSGRSISTGDNPPTGGDQGSAVNSGTMSSNCGTSGGAVGLVGSISATGVVLVYDTVSGNVVDGVVGVSSMGDAALGGMIGGTACDVLGGSTGGTAGGMTGVVGSTMGTTVGMGGASVVGNGGWG